MSGSFEDVRATQRIWGRIQQDVSTEIAILDCNDYEISMIN